MAYTILRLPEVLQRTGLSRSSVYKGINEKNFPKPIKLGQRAIGWPSEVIDQWIEERIIESRESGEG